MGKEFHIFKSNTDAPATNRGFYFQYLLTLQLWISKHDNPSFEIYCEREDDILLIDATNDSRHYTQVKCYSTNFALNSSELIKSLINFYQLYLKYHNNYRGTYNFCVSSGIKPRAGQTLQQWYNRQLQGDFNIDDYIIPTREAIVNYLHNMSEEYSSVTHDATLISHAKARIDDFKNNINSKDFENFLQKIRWNFKEYTEDSFEKLIDEIATMLLKTNYNKNIDARIFLGYLLHHVIDRSSLANADDRKLDHSLFERLIANTAHKNLVFKTLENEFSEIFTLLPGIQRVTAKIERNTTLIIEKLEKISQPSLKYLDLFYDDLRDWFTAIDYSFGDVNIKNVDDFYFDIKIQERRKIITVLIHGLTRQIQVPDIENITKLKKHYDCDEAWIVSTSYPSPAARKKISEKLQNDILCYNFDELLEETINFSKYFDWIEREIKTKKIDERFIPVAVKKGEFSPQTKEVIATSIYGKAEGWLEGYINSWLNDQQKEHVSILGEFGTGKTWFTLYYSWKQIQLYHDAKINRKPRPRIPILIFLRDFAKAMQVDVLISDFFFRKHQIDMKGVFAAFNQLNKMGKLLLIFDGFDEMADRIDKQKMIDNFWELASVVKGQSKVILTCRNEHFSTIKEGRNLLNSELKNSTNTINDESPKFEVVELLRFDHSQIKQLLGHFTNEATISLIFRNQNIVDLLSRPVMVELVLDAIKEIEHEQELDLSKIYFYATRRKMERDIAQHRTFTSLADKLFFMSELAWEMLSNNKLTIN